MYSYRQGFNNDQGIFGRHADGKSRVHDSAMVAHIWANQTLDCARNGKGSVYFKGRTIYSYGAQWPLATITDRQSADGKTIIVINVERYERGEKFGNSTARHLRLVQNALRNHDAYDTVSADCETTKLAITNAMAAFERIAQIELHTMQEKLADLCNMRKRCEQYDNAMGGWREMTAAERASCLTDVHLIHICHRMQIAVPTYDLEAMRAEINAAAVKYLEGEPKREKARAARAKRECLVRLEKWHTQKTSSIWTVGRSRIDDSEAWRYLVTAMQNYPAARWEKYRVLLQQRALLNEIDDTFRLVHPDAQNIAWDMRYRHLNKAGITLNEWLTGKTGRLRPTIWGSPSTATLMRKRNERLETTAGVEVPWQQAVRCFRIAVDCYNRGDWFEPANPANPITIGHFKLDRIDEDGTLHAGCHHLQFKDMLALACQEEPLLAESVKPRYPVPALIEE